MTVSTTTSRSSSTGNGVSTVFGFSIPFIAASDLQVYVDGVLKTITTDYTVSGTAPYPTGANVVFVSPPANLSVVLIVRVRPYTQTLDLVENDPLPAAQVELLLGDHEIMLAQQLKEITDRALVIPITDTTGTAVTIPAAASRANKLLGFDSSGNPTVTTGTAGPQGPSGNIPFAVAGGTANAITADFSPDLSLATEPIVAVVLGAANSLTNPTLATDGTTARTITKNGGQALAANDLAGALAVALLKYNLANTRWELMNPAAAPAAVAGVGFKNLLIGGDFATNPWQRGVASFTAIATTPTYTADRWFGLAGAGATETVAQTTASTLANFPTALRVQRPNTNTNTTDHRICQIVEAASMRSAQGQTVSVSFYARAGANFSAASSQMKVKLTTGTTADEGATAFASGWTGAASPLNTTQVITTSWARYTFTAAVGSTANELALDLGFTPVGTAGANDYFEIAGVQVEVAAAATAFENLPVDVVLARCLRYTQVIKYIAAQDVLGIGQAQSATTAQAAIPLRGSMRAVPSVTVSAAGDFYTYGANGSAITITSLTWTQTTDKVLSALIGVAAGLVAGNASLMVTKNSTALITASAEL